MCSSIGTVARDQPSGLKTRRLDFERRSRSGCFWAGVRLLVLVGGSADCNAGERRFGRRADRPMTNRPIRPHGSAWRHYRFTLRSPRIES